MRGILIWPSSILVCIVCILRGISKTFKLGLASFRTISVFYIEHTHRTQRCPLIQAALQQVIVG